MSVSLSTSLSGTIQKKTSFSALGVAWSKEMPKGRLHDAFMSKNKEAHPAGRPGRVRDRRRQRGADNCDNDPLLRRVLTVSADRDREPMKVPLHGHEHEPMKIDEYTLLSFKLFDM